ncbi:MAG: glycosyltransferase [Chloroflexota bacterium]
MFTGIQTLTISNGIDLQKFHPPLSFDDETATRTKLNLPLNIPIILHVGRLDTDKHVERIITAAVLALQNTDAHLLIVGDGCEKNSLMNFCSSFEIAHRVHFSEFISDRQYLSEIYRMASLFVTASEIETQGIVLLEAAASGLPVVAVEATCIPEIIQDQINGYLVKPGDTHALSDAIMKVLAYPDQATHMGQAGYKRV